jgi:hypothetical protein
VRLLIADQIRRMRETMQVELFQDHGSSLSYGGACTHTISSSR